MTLSKPLITIGRAEQIRFPDFGDKKIPAKVDTGADMSSVWASDILEQDDHLSFVLFGNGSAYYTGQRILLPKGSYSVTRIANSFGVKELRYVVTLRIALKGRVVRASFSLADRSPKTYPILLGRRLLKGKFVVDVAQGKPLVRAEKEKKAKMRLELTGDEG